MQAERTKDEDNALNRAVCQMQTLRSAKATDIARGKMRSALLVASRAEREDVARPGNAGRTEGLPKSCGVAALQKAQAAVRDNLRVLRDQASELRAECKRVRKKAPKVRAALIAENLQYCILESANETLCRARSCPPSESQSF